MRTGIMLFHEQSFLMAIYDGAHDTIMTRRIQPEKRVLPDNHRNMTHYLPCHPKNIQVLDDKQSSKLSQFLELYLSSIHVRQECILTIGYFGSLLQSSKQKNLYSFKTFETFTDKRRRRNVLFFPNLYVFLSC